MHRLILFLLLIAAQTQAFTFVGLKPEKTSVRVILSDGIECLWSPSREEKLMLKHWKKGDKIRIDSNWGSPILNLYNEDSDIYYFPKVHLDEKSISALPSIYSLVKTKDSCELYLNDGTAWKKKWSIQEISLWEEGDPLIINRDEGYSSIINYRLATSDDEEDRAQSDRDFSEL